MKITMQVGNKQYERDGITCGDYEDFIELREAVNPDGDYSIDDMKKMRKALAIAFKGQVTEDELRDADATEIIYQFMAVDALVAGGLKSKVEKMKSDFGLGE